MALTSHALANPPGAPDHAPPSGAGDGTFHSEDLQLANGEVSLAATLLLPEGHGPLPGIVVVPGSGPHTRAFARLYTEAFAGAGFAVLSYDKRGSGESTGNWVTASLEDLASDAAAAMDYLAGRPEVDPGRVGIWAPSQGAWVSSVLHSQGADIAFLAVMSGGGVTPRESETYSYHQALARMGASNDDVALADALLDDYFEFLASGEGREALVEKIGAAEGEPWYAALNLGRVLPSDKNRPNWAWVASYDPLPAIETMQFPVLLLFGEVDEQQPTKEALARWQAGLARAGNRAVCARVFPGANHFLRMAGEGGGHDAPLAKGFLEQATGWLRAVAHGESATTGVCERG